MEASATVKIPHLSIVPDTEAPRITLLEADLMRLWCLGVLNDRAYVYFVLRHMFNTEWSDRLEDGQFPSKIELSQNDLLYISSAWSADSKELTDKKILTAIVALTNLKECVCLSAVQQLSLLDPGALFL
jgi:hypothetical protein